MSPYCFTPGSYKILQYIKIKHIVVFNMTTQFWRIEWSTKITTK